MLEFAVDDREVEHRLDQCEATLQGLVSELADVLACIDEWAVDGVDLHDVARPRGG